MFKLNIKRKRKIIIFSVLLISLVFSCKKDTINENTKINNLTETTAFVKFNFPDTVYVNKFYNGKIEYKGVLDTITTSFDDNIKSRYVSFYMTKTKNIDYEMNQLYKIKLDTFGAIDNRTIPFYDVKFSELGIHYIDGLINDHVIIDTLIRTKPKGKVRYIENVLRTTHKVVVIESSK